MVVVVYSELRKWRAVVAIMLLLLLEPTHGARADAVTGRWSGSVEGRANLYQERSTRALAPELELQAVSPSGLRLGAAYLVDVISSASVAQGGGEDRDVFTELRHGARVELGDELRLEGGDALDLSASGTFSTEDDYKSFGTATRAALALDQRATVVGLSLSYAHDEVRSNLDPDFADSMSAIGAGMGVERVLHPRVVLRLGYRVGYLEGFLANVYRRVIVGPLPVLETHPRRRARHNASASLALAVPESDTAIHLMYRAYLDSWDVGALTPELRVYQELLSDLSLRVRYRYYTQTAAFFFRDAYPVGWTGYVTSDPKMAAIHTHTLGLSLSWRIGGDLLPESWLDLGVDRYLSSSAYGDGVIGTAGLRMEL